MPFCKNCGVELEADMLNCPLCGVPAGDRSEAKALPDSTGDGHPSQQTQKKMTGPQKKIIWEVISITILSFIIATLSIDLILNGRISWSEYPVALCLVVFSYISIFTVLDQRAITSLTGGFLASAVFMALFDRLTGGIAWSVKLGIPLLFSGNLIAAALFFAIRRTRKKGINLIAYFFIAAALYCTCIEGIISYFKTGDVHLRWSLVVIACVLPVAFVLFFVHYRLAKSHILERTFHI